MLFTSQIKLKNYELLLHWWSGSGHKITYYQYFTHIAYKGEGRKGEMKNYLGEKLLNDLQFYWKIFYVAL